MMLVANQEFISSDNEYQVKSAKWPISILQEGGNVLASIAGASTTSPGSEGPSPVQSALGGALSGAAVGASVGGPYGAAAGAVIGGAAGLLAG